MKTYKELTAKWLNYPERDLMSPQEEKEYVNDWYEIGRHLPTKPFEPNFTDYKKYKGQTFTIVDIVDTSETELENLPFWKIKMSDGNIIWATCDEIFDIDSNIGEKESENMEEVEKPENKGVYVLYVHNCDMSRVLLTLNPDIDNDTAINAIFEAIKENELYDIDEEEYNEVTTNEELMSYARSIWYYHESIYVDTRWEATYSIATNVKFLTNK